MGTVGYMSPEQVRGKPVDARSDIFSLGSILYEMLSGERAFRGESAAESMAAVAQKDPPALSEPSGLFPPAVERILRHCLEKRPEDRFDTAHDLAFALEGVLGVASTSGAQAKVDPRSTPRRGRMIALGLMIALAAAGFVLGRLSRRNKIAVPSAQPVRFLRLTDSPGVESEPSLSPDGKSVVYVSDAGGRLGLYLLRVGGRNPTPLTADSPVDDWQPAFSPDGERIAFRSEREGGGIFVMGSTGESVKRITDFGFNPSWSPDGREIVVANGAFLFPSDRGGRIGGLVAVNLETGKKREVSTAGDCMQPSWSPHGNRIAYWGLRGTSGQRDLFTVAADGSEAKADGIEVTKDAPLDWSPTWSPDGKYLYFSSNRGGTMNLWRVAIAEATGRVLGEPEPITTPSNWSGEMSFSRDGTKIAYASLDWRSSLFKVAFDPKTETTSGPPVPILKGTQPIRDHQLSADGQWIAFMQTGGQEDLFIVRTDGSQFRRLTDDSFRDRGPSWSPDGKLLAFYSDRTGGYQVWTIRPDGSGLEQLTRMQGSMNYPVWSPDGRTMATAVIPGGWYLIDVAAGGFPRPSRLMPSVGREEGFWPLCWSPDGQLLSGVLVEQNGTVRAIGTYSLARGQYEVVDVGPGGLWRVPMWLADSRRLLVRDRWGIFLLDTLTKKMHRLISVGGYGVGLSVGISRDDRWITYTETATEGDIWLAELK
jgi:eukaryotic-like serine/threonine-protein kinase